MNPTSPNAPAAPVRGASIGFIVCYVLATCGVWMALMTPPIMTLALRVAQVDPEGKTSTLAWVLGVGAVVAMLANPIAGLFSDRTASAFGMRRPWLMAGALVGTAGLYLTAIGGLWSVAIGWWLAQLGFNVLLAALTALLPDQVPSHQRGTVSGALGICVQLGILGGVGLAQAAGDSVVGMFMLPASVAVVAVLLLCLLMHDRRLAAPPPALKLAGFFKSFAIDPRRSPDFAWAFVSRFLLFMGLATLLSYQVYFLTDRLGLPAAEVPGAMLKSTLVTTAATVLASLLGGWLSDRARRRKPFVLAAAALYAAGLALIAASASFEGFLWGLAVCGLGQGAYFAVDLALVADVLPDEAGQAAKDLGIFNLASAMPQSVAPALAPLFLGFGSLPIQGGNYPALFIAAAVFAALGAAAIAPIRGVP
jgi:MFS family permease